MESNGVHTFVVADPQSLTRYGLVRLLESQRQFRVLGEVASGAEALDAVRRHHPHCLLLAFDLSDISGLQVLKELASWSSTLHRIMLASGPDPALVVQALHLGARGVLKTDWSTELLLRTISKILLAGEYCVDREYVAHLVHAMNGESASKRVYGLTGRELQLVELIVDGCSNRDIAGLVHISEQTVKHHLSNIFDKLGVSSRLELAAFATHHRLSAATTLEGSTPPFRRRVA